MSSVLVTGANGFVGFHTLKTLLNRGYSVVGAVRSESKTSYLRTAFNFTDKLKFAVVEDITAAGAFDKVIQDYAFDAVLHIGSPYSMTIKDVEKEVYEPAINGTTGILKSIKAYGPTVKRVVITSSFASVVDAKKGPRPGYVYTETDWNPVTREEGLGGPSIGYYASKKLAEGAAWDFMENEKPHFTLTTLTPPMVYGPPEQEIPSLDKLNTSAAGMYGIFSGKKEPSQSVYLWVDVRDLALAHVLAIESDAAANQRYLITQGRYSAQQFVEYIWEHYPEQAKEKGVTKGTPGRYFPEEGTYTGDNSKSIKDLGLQYRDLDTMQSDTYKRFEQLEAETK